MDRDIVGRLVALKRFRAGRAEDTQRQARAATLAAFSAAEAAARRAEDWTREMPARTAAIYAPLIGQVVAATALDTARQATVGLRSEETLLLQRAEDARTRLREGRATEEQATAALASARRGVEKFTELVRALRLAAAGDAAREEDAVMEEAAARRQEAEDGDGMDATGWEAGDEQGWAG